MTYLGITPENVKTTTDTWLTPLWLINALGDFDLDPCGIDGHDTAKNKIIWPQDGLKSDWFGKVWLNPPYSDLNPWMDKLSNHGCGTALVFARTDTKWMQKHFRLADSVFFLEGRIRFLDANFKEKTNVRNEGLERC